MIRRRKRHAKPSTGSCSHVRVQVTFGGMGRMTVCLDCYRYWFG